MATWPKTLTAEEEAELKKKCAFCQHSRWHHYNAGPCELCQCHHYNKKIENEFDLPTER